MHYSRTHRRHHVDRLKAKRRLEERQRLRDDLQYVEVRAAKRVHTPRACSCWMCGNPRRYNGNAQAAFTRQELRSDLAFREIE